MSFDRSIFTKVIAALSLATTVAIFPAGARLGDKFPSDDTPARYGQPVGETTPMLVGSKEKVLIFRKKDTNITTEYDSLGEVWRLTFQTKVFDKYPKEIIEALKKSGGPLTWSSPMRFRGNDHYVTSDGSMHAIYYQAPHFKLVIMTRAALEAELLPQTLEGRSEETDGGGEPGEEKDPNDGKKKSHFDDF